MAKSQENGTTILLGLKGYEVVTVTESEGKIIVEASAQGAMARGFTLSYPSSAGGARAVVTLSMTVHNYCDPIPE